MSIEKNRIENKEKLKEICSSNNCDFTSLIAMLEAEKIKKIQKRNHYVKDTIEMEIEKQVNL